MKRTLLLLSVVLFLISVIPAWCQTDGPEESVAAMTGPEAEVPEIEIIMLEDGTEEVQEILPASAYAPVTLDGRFLAIKANAKQRIDAILMQIQELDDKNEEGELQRQIEQIKLDEEIERLTLLKEDAETHEDYDLADEIAGEIEHLGRIDEPVVGSGQEQQPQ